jgi:hypothetical protein
MSFRYQKRVNLGKGAGLNISKSGVSGSIRGRVGSVGTRGFSLKTGIPGLTFRSSWGRSKHGLILILCTGVILFAALVVYNLFRLLGYLGQRAYQAVTPLKNEAEQDPTEKSG